MWFTSRVYLKYYSIWSVSLFLLWIWCVSCTGSSICVHFLCLACRAFLLPPSWSPLLAGIPVILKQSGRRVGKSDSVFVVRERELLRKWLICDLSLSFKSIAHISLYLSPSLGAESCWTWDNNSLLSVGHFRKGILVYAKGVWNSFQISLCSSLKWKTYPGVPGLFSQ